MSLHSRFFSLLPFDHLVDVTVEVLGILLVAEMDHDHLLSCDDLLPPNIAQVPSKGCKKVLLPYQELFSLHPRLVILLYQYLCTLWLHFYEG
jgi:hypothetical protein